MLNRRKFIQTSLIAGSSVFLPLGRNVWAQKNTPGNKAIMGGEDLFNLFQNPPASAKPFVRWWWNGDCIEPDELERELDVMQAAGIGGVEINPIAKPDGGHPVDCECYDWLSPEWNKRVKETIEMAKQRGMVVDLIMGSGWPFGGEFLKEDQFLQGVGIRKMEFDGPLTVPLNIKEEWQLPGNDSAHINPDAPDAELFFLQLIPHGASSEADLVDLIADVNEDGTVEIKVPKGKHDLYIGTKQRAYRTVMHGAPGSKGPVVDHYDADDVRAYMDKLSDALEPELGGKMGDHIRSLFCDSIELSGANITDDFFEAFETRRGYNLKPFIPLVYYHPYQGFTDKLNYAESFNKDIKRIRYDFNKTLVELFLERFTQTFHNWANEHGMKSRYQAYGMPWLMGMLDGYRMVDIPESNNWIYSPDAKSHGYWIWNKYTSSAAHLSGAKVVSSEAMTNTRGVFRATLDTIKKNDDFNFISGINHSILHGYNYSPPEAGFPGWVRYGAYFSDQNTWWPYFKHWSKYNARLSALFQNSTPVTDVAILTPEADIWKEWGLMRTPFYINPWYNHDLWEGFSRIGVAADYINEGVLQRATAEGTELKSEKAVYKLVIVSSANAILPATAKAIYELAKQGVKFLFVDQLPSETPSYFEKEKGDQEVRSVMSKALALENVVVQNAPEKGESVTRWASGVKAEFNLQVGITIDGEDEKLYVLKHQTNSCEIFFLSNQDEAKEQVFKAIFANKEKTAWRWNPQTGERYLMTAYEPGVINIKLQPLESMLVVLDDRKDGEVASMGYPDEKSGVAIGGDWKMKFKPFKGEEFEIASEKLFEFGNHTDQRIATFAGQVCYETNVELEDAAWAFVDLGIEKQITEVKINSVELGTRWWGRHLYAIPENTLRKGENKLQIKYTTTLANYANSLTENSAAKRWIILKEPESIGLKSDVKLLRMLL
ncbi:glycosyl hydrolase [Mangrovibacterium sp.]|uniref:glycosyl hydrolase n=1 Tax=Mangrovibacterium sp. TaxID=1961364 RepID=UPI003562417D